MNLEQNRGLSYLIWILWTESIKQEVIEMGPVLNFTHQTLLVQPYSTEDVKKAVFSIHSTKSPGHDGFNSEFFKKTWDIIGSDVCKAVLGFFDTGQLVGDINHTVLVLLPKKEDPQEASEYRPIACCTVLYKII